MKKTQQASQDYQTKPKPREKFKPSKCKEILKETLDSKLKDQTYNDIPNVSRELADTIKYKLKESGYNRYKFIVHVIIGQQKGTP